ncbi:hypothetical protein ACWGJB_40380, partial [Streptomyces sp. NPDC054813]
MDDAVADASGQGGGLVDLGAFSGRERHERVLDVAGAAGPAALRVPGGDSGAERLARYAGVFAVGRASGARTVAVISH